MDDRRQKNQLELAWREEVRGEAPKLISVGTESSAAKCGTENPAIIELLMEEVCERENCKLRIPGQGDRDSEVIPIRIPKLI